MCVIAVVLDDKKRLSNDMVEKMWETNSHGAGLAWREKDANGVTQVQWVKGIIKVDEVKEYLVDLPTPHVVHFRIPTEGGTKRELCHPFHCVEGVPLDLMGETTDDVMFHNGHWNAWRTTTWDECRRHKVKIPAGPWSDSRAMALMVHVFGPGALEFIGEKAVLFGPKTLQFFGGPWFEVNGIHVSNRHWESRGTVVHKGGSTGTGATRVIGHATPSQPSVSTAMVPTRSEVSTPVTGALGGATPPETFRTRPGDVRGEPTEPEEVEECETGIRSVYAEGSGEGEEAGNDPVLYLPRAQEFEYLSNLINSDNVAIMTGAERRRAIEYGLLDPVNDQELRMWAAGRNPKPHKRAPLVDTRVSTLADRRPADPGAARHSILRKKYLDPEMVGRPH